MTATIAAEATIRPLSEVGVILAAVGSSPLRWHTHRSENEAFTRRPGLGTSKGYMTSDDQLALDGALRDVVSVGDTE